ncbi:prolyl oligopeptidase family serine peptidase [Brachybacterium sacelli]|uniref:Dipeptidyl aminopeptidase/acylaminoacyl peptidase n=1 Tax=Brachybacterium sacelli TaxID=173364 RepID=A0ABS4WWH5_9MICO|nr:prolyl oligopeptidase family serine peptidase [Brachybacterium sacelli]MBP2380554.1 dipeptidyl aminopeptidase/acylaminoacyl peptidase [Brachybacterium sacelli]
MVTTLPYGSWPSPISAELLATGGTRLSSPRLVGDAVWWSEGIATEGGRQAIVRSAGPVPVPGTPADGGTGEPGAGSEAGHAPAPAVTVLPAPFNARSRVHEYGGASWTVVPGNPAPPARPPSPPHRPLVVFVNFEDQRVHALREGEQPRPLTPVGPEVETAHGPSLRWADPTVVTLVDGTREVWWICEDHTGGELGPRLDEDGAPHIERYIAAVPLDGSAAEDLSAIRRVTPASRFVAHPRVSPDGTRMSWLTWQHPQLPWDGTELHVAPLLAGSAGVGDVVAGDTGTSVMQPEWLDDHRLMFVSDTSGWWNPWSWSAADGARQLLELDQEFAGPMWALGTTWYQVLDPDLALVTYGRAATGLGLLRTSDGRLTPLESPLTDIAAAELREDGLLLLAGSSPTRFGALHTAHLRLPSDGSAPALSPLTLLRSSRDDAPDPSVLPRGESIEVPLPDGGVVHAIVHPPHQEGLAGREGELPPFIARVHGGPTGHVPPVLSLPTAYYTSRGLGVVDVNYGGSTGYGRAYRDRLRGQWGVVDVADTVAVMDHLVREGIADGRRLAIEGGSAGGWTTLACLTRTDTFAAGASSFGVAELEAFRLDTHDFESRYIDGLVGPYPERRDLYVERAPLTHVDELEVPVLLLQGDEDRIVPPSQSELFRDALAAKGIPHAYLLFEGEQHGFRQADSIIRATEATLSFYGQVLGFSPPCVPVLELQRD